MEQHAHIRAPAPRRTLSTHLEVDEPEGETETEREFEDPMSEFEDQMDIDASIGPITPDPVRVLDGQKGSKGKVSLPLDVSKFLGQCRTNRNRPPNLHELKEPRPSHGLRHLVLHHPLHLRKKRRPLRLCLLKRRRPLHPIHTFMHPRPLRTLQMRHSPP